MRYKTKLKTMTLVLTKSADPSISTGSVAQKDFLNYGSIGVTFYKSSHIVGVEIAGFMSQSVYYLNPTEKQKRTNSLFIEKYVNKCVNPQEILSKFQ